MKLAMLMTGDPENRKGVFNSAIQRGRRLKQVNDNVDFYMIRLRYGFFLSLLKSNVSSHVCSDYTIVDGLRFKNIWVKLGLLDYIFTHRLSLRVASCAKQLVRHSHLFEGYELLITHGVQAAYLASVIKKDYGVPFAPTWHGSEMNVSPFKSKFIRYEFKNLIESADQNFFVSEKLMQVSDRITRNANKQVLYSAPADYFYRYADSMKLSERDKLGISSRYAVGYVGSFYKIKNVLILPLIFKRLQETLSDVSFIIVGDGVLESSLLADLDENGVCNTTFLGKVAPDQIPAVMNCLDALILPSLNEGLPCVTLEALACGAHVVGSNRGGIPEAIGYENCFELDSDFVEKISARVVELLRSSNKPSLPDKFNCDLNVRKEVSIYKKIIG